MQRLSSADVVVGDNGQHKTERQSVQARGWRSRGGAKGAKQLVNSAAQYSTNFGILRDTCGAMYLVIATVPIVFTYPWQHSTMVKIWEMNHKGSGHPKLFLRIFHYTVVIDTGGVLALWQ